MPSTDAPVATNYCEYPLIDARKRQSSVDPASHQQGALAKLQGWYEAEASSRSGGILVLPTGGGKTFTALRFLARGPLSGGYKVLWLAHTHHLLDQAYRGLDLHVGHIGEPKNRLTVRVVSGAPGHLPVHTIRPTDDIIVGTIQTIAGAHRDGHPAWRKFLESSGGRLFVVFDEAHHAAAPSYRRLLTSLRDECAQAKFLGLTATPYRMDETNTGWLRDLFPQEILYQVTPAALIAARILSRPIIEEPQTNIEADFDEREFQKWIGTCKDLPEELVTNLAKNRTRNDFIASTYVANREKYGKTIIFADRFYQCDYIREYLCRRGVRADVVYSHVDRGLPTVEERNRRDSSENQRVLDAFRQGKLDVIVNVRMLTEGTDIPDAQTVFITRQTTSRILMTQMVGRALRGPKFGGTDDAYIVCFNDKWHHLIDWARYDQLEEGSCDDTQEETKKRPPLQLISIELVRSLARMMDSGQNIETMPFLEHLPVGWYQVSYLAAVEGSDDLEPVHRLVMVFANDVERYARFVDAVMQADVAAFADEDVRLESVRDTLASWAAACWPKGEQAAAGCIESDLFPLARHIAQNRVAPRYFPFEERDAHDLDVVVRDVIAQGLGPSQTDVLLRGEYECRDKFWAALFWPYRLFKSQFDACMNRALEAQHQGEDAATYQPPKREHPERLPEREPTEAVKRQVKEGDGHRCLCCDSTDKRSLTVDHTHPRYLGGPNVRDNLQTLCAACNGIKGTLSVNFRDPQTNLVAPLTAYPEVRLLDDEDPLDGTRVERFLRRGINLFYRCRAVHSVSVPTRRFTSPRIVVELGVGNQVDWLRPHLKQLLTRIREATQVDGVVPDAIVVSAPDQTSIAFPAERRESIGRDESAPRRSKLSKRAVLSRLDLANLRQLVAQFELELQGARRKDEIVSVLTRARRVSLDQLLAAVSLEVLRELCEEAGSERPGRSRSDVIQTLRSLYEDEAE